MTTTMHPRPETDVPAIRQNVVDQLTALLAHDDITGFSAVERRLGATRAEVAAASAGLVESRRLALPALEHTLQVLEDVARLPEPETAPPV